MAFEIKLFCRIYIKPS